MERNDAPSAASYYRARTDSWKDHLKCSCCYHDDGCQYHDDSNATLDCDCDYHGSTDYTECDHLELSSSCTNRNRNIESGDENSDKEGNKLNADFHSTAIPVCEVNILESPLPDDDFNLNETNGSIALNCDADESELSSECHLSSATGAVSSCDGGSSTSLHKHNHHSTNDIEQNDSNIHSTLLETDIFPANTLPPEQSKSSLHSYSPSSSGTSDDDIFKCSGVTAHYLDEINEDERDEDRNEYYSPSDSGGDDDDDDDDDDDENDSNPDDPPDLNPDDDPDDPDPANDPLAQGNGNQNGPYFSLENPRLNRILELGFECTVREAVAMVAAIGVRYNMEYDLLVKIFRLSNIMLGEAQLPSTKDQLWSILNRRREVSRRHAYCGDCHRNLGLYSDLQRIVACPCGIEKPRKKVKYFITLSISAQLKQFLEIPGMWEKLQHRQERQIINQGAKEDTFDGDCYIHLKNHYGLREPYDFTYNFNLDAFRMTKSSNKQATPIFIRLNEAPPNLRQQFVFLAGLWVDNSPPILSLFMERFVTECNSLSTVGLAWTPPGYGEEVISKFFPACCCVDAVERASLMCHTTHAGVYACPFCTIQGVYINAMKFPLPGTELNLVRRRQNEEYIERIVVPEPQLRTDASSRQAMDDIQEAQDAGAEINIEGVVGSSSLKELQFFNLVDGLSSDDLHPIYLGVAAFHMRLILRRLNARQINAINVRLLAIKCPTNISRKPRKLEKKRNLKGSEWAHILLYFGVPCMQGIVEDAKISHFGLLSSAVYMLSRDSITEQNFLTADRLIRLYLLRFQNTFGTINMRFNVHMMSHLVSVSRKWGPLFAHSTGPFESMNCIMGNKVTSPKAAADQIVQRYFLKALIAEVPGSADINEVVKEEIAFIMQKDTSRPTLVFGNNKFYGSATERVVTMEERQALEDEGLDFVRLQEFVKLKYNFLEFRSINYHPDEDIRSDNSFVYTYSIFFGRILSIVALGEAMNRVAGMFVERFNVGRRLSGVHHIVELLDRADIHFVTPDEVRNLSIKISVRNVNYIMAMANQFEID
ncbi:Putative pre-16S rRNA nuclease [Frankliniella fusca]|uniref:Pre-16S rRNA nuclease n=1 Tax=Frankliniella fusca TaxID=407009 RepID=A0AAE1I5P0_9NEOP|nr:Putative pre-16S rRNA nuclease [Frankliniella fusca]